jgi:hypothetical protein
MNIGIHKDTKAVEELPYEWVPLRSSSATIINLILSSGGSSIRTDVYGHEVDYVVIQSADGSQTHVFHNYWEISVSFSPVQSSKVLISLLTMVRVSISSSCITTCSDILECIHGKMKDPIMRGQKIIKGYIFNEITLIDSYNYISAGLSTMPKMFGFQELHKGFFPHYFNLPPFQDYIGPVPDKEWYGYMEMKPKQQEEFVKWYDKQIREQGGLRFQTGNA